MLILSRHREEEILVTVPPGTEPRTIKIKILKGGLVKLGFEADEDISILRTELLGAKAPSK